MKSGKVQRFRKGRKDSKNWNSKDARKIEKAWILNDRQLSIISWKSGIQKFKDSKKDRRNQTCKDAESFRLRGGFIEGLDNDIGELKKFEREREREKEGRKTVAKSVKIGFYGRYFCWRGRLFTAPSVSPTLFIFIGHLRAVGVHERHGRFRDHVTNVLIFQRCTCQPAISVSAILGTGPPVPVPK